MYPPTRHPLEDLHADFVEELADRFVGAFLKWAPLVEGVGPAALVALAALNRGDWDGLQSVVLTFEDVHSVTGLIESMGVPELTALKRDLARAVELHDATLSACASKAARQLMTIVVEESQLECSLATCATSLAAWEKVVRMTVENKTMPRPEYAAKVRRHLGVAARLANYSGLERVRTNAQRIPVLRALAFELERAEERSWTRAACVEVVSTFAVTAATAYFCCARTGRPGRVAPIVAAVLGVVLAAVPYRPNSVKERRIRMAVVIGLLSAAGAAILA